MSSSLGDTAALFLGIVFAAAGIAKWRTPSATEASFRAFGLARPAFLARAVPVIEMVTGLGLVAAPRFFSLVALALLVVFTTVLLRGLRAGVAVGCTCFGSTGHKPVSSLDVIRNTLFAALALGAALLSETGFANPSLPAAIFIGGGAAAATGLFALARAHHDQQTGVATSHGTSAEEGLS